MEGAGKRNAKDYNVWPAVARYDPEKVLKIQDYKTNVSPGLLKTFRIGALKTTLKMFCFLVPFYAIQVSYYSGFLHTMCCAAGNNGAVMLDPDDEDREEQTRSYDEDECEEGMIRFLDCDEQIKGFFEHIKGNSSDILRLVTFLLGFYVSNITKRFWDQVHSLPSVDAICLYMNGLVWSAGKNDLAKNNPENIQKELRFKRVIARYCLLSWTMATTVLSPGMEEAFPNTDTLLQKGLITQAELRTMGADRMGHMAWCDHWRTPLNWAAVRINERFQNGALVPKDHKDLVGALMKFQNGFVKLIEYSNHPVPSYQTYAVKFCLYSSFFIDILSAQNFTSNYDNNLWILILHLPGTFLIQYLVLFAWLSVADSLSDPFDNNGIFDEDLAADLESEIWKCSSLINSSAPDDIPAEEDTMESCVEPRKQADVEVYAISHGYMMQ